MRVAPILTNETCNHRCAFCSARRPVERAAVAAPAAIRARIDALREPCEVTLTGGEPTLRKDLPAIVAYARSRGHEVALETNAAALDRAAVDRLRAAGLARARVHLPGWGDDADRVTGDPGGFARTRAAIDHLRAAGVAVELALPLTRETLAAAPQLPAHLERDHLGALPLVLIAPVLAPDPASLLTARELTCAIAAVAEAARAHGVAVRLSPDTFIPPCLFERPARVAHLYALTPGGRDRPGFTRPPACAACTVHDRCPGLPDALRRREPDLSPRPQAEDRLRRRLSLISTVDAQIARELVTPELYRRGDGVLQRATTIRVHFHCNQACDFCFVSTHLPPPAEAAVEAAIREAARDRGIVVLSGGEPTLNPRLVDYIALARASGAREVELQTNAVRLGEPGLAERLRGAGLDRAFVSLHGATAATGDAVTRAPGTFERTLIGVDALTAAGLEVRLNFVICQRNYHELPAAIDLIHRRWPAASLCVSFVGPSTDLVPHTRDLIPRYSDITPHLTEALRRARAHRLQVTGFDSMCGIPLCLVPQDLGQFVDLAEIPPGFDRGEFIKADACRACAIEPRCFGVRRRYVDLHGDGELRPVAPANASQPAAPR